jgi:diketogulonate reductase-like aldo/keto reductase
MRRFAVKPAMRTVTLPSGPRVPAFGMGTWYMGDDPAQRVCEVAALKLGLDLGASLVDTAEMYADGKAEEVVGEAISGRRDEVFLVSKVYPHNATRRATVSACERSLRRLKTDRLDLYLLHWRGSVPLHETMEALASLQSAGKIRHYGVSNFDLGDMTALWKIPDGRAVETNQLLYNLARRGIEWDLLPWMRERHIPVMAYSPLEQARLIKHAKLARFARANGMTPAQAALAWLLRDEDVIVIPKSSDETRLRENLGALDIELTRDQIAELDRIFPPPAGARPLEML